MTERIPAPSADTFLITQEYRRFAEFCDACRQYRYIGLCYGPPGVGKTLSARHYAQWDMLAPALEDQRRHAPGEPPPEVADCHTLFYTPTVTVTPRRLADDLLGLCRLLDLTGQRAQRPAPGTVLLLETEPAHTDLVIIDEADRLKFPTLEQLRDLYDRTGFGLVLIGMPGLEKRLARYAQFYSRVGFVHQFRTLSPEAMRLILAHKWEQLGLKLVPDEFTDAESMVTIIRSTGGNFRLVQRLFSQIERILQINRLETITPEVVQAARESLVIGTG
jgi:DNA transposition AAA+ family ATPase